MAAASTFHKFMELSIELRLMIWEHTFEARNLQLNLLSDGLRISGDPSRDYDIPNALQIHRESRHKFLPRYLLLFSGKFEKCTQARMQPEFTLHAARRALRFNPNFDVLSIENPLGRDFVSSRKIHGDPRKRSISIEIRCIGLMNNVLDTTDRRPGENSLDQLNGLETVFVLERGGNNFPVTAYLQDIRVDVVESPGLMIESFVREVKKQSSDWMAPNVRVLDLDTMMGSSERWWEALD